MPVVEERGDALARPDAERAQPVREPIDALLELAVVEPHLAVDERGAERIGERVQVDDGGAAPDAAARVARGLGEREDLPRAEGLGEAGVLEDARARARHARRLLQAPNPLRKVHHPPPRIEMCFCTSARAGASDGASSR